MNLRGESSDCIAAELQRRNVRFVIATGYCEQIENTDAPAPVLGKPYTEERLLAALTRVLTHGRG